MLIRLGYDMLFDTPSEVPIVTLLNVHPSRKKRFARTRLTCTPIPSCTSRIIRTAFGNHGCRLLAPPGKIRLHNSTLIEDSGQPDVEGFDAYENRVEDFPSRSPALPHEQPLLRG